MGDKNHALNDDNTKVEESLMGPIYTTGQQ